MLEAGERSGLEGGVKVDSDLGARPVKGTRPGLTRGGPGTLNPKICHKWFYLEYTILSR
jgi:hypothetical protein